MTKEEEREDVERFNTMFRIKEAMIKARTGTGQKRQLIKEDKQAIKLLLLVAFMVIVDLFFL